ncbi:MAG: DNA translocase FtsK [Acutalibacteraceae bacterium]|nr:DNA translocase FtsK [Acutalibacteraceae bacterium]
MATSQKGSSNRKTTNSRSGAKSGGSRSGSAKKTAQRNSKAAKSAQKASNNKQMGAIILFAVALFLAFLAFIKGGGVWLVLQNVFFGLFGVMAYVIPFLLIAVAILISMDRDTDNLQPKIVLAMLFIWFLCAAIYVFAGDGAPSSIGSGIAGAYQLGQDGLSGGAIGAILGAPLLRLFINKLPAGLTLILLAFVTLMLLSGTTLVRLYHYIVDPAEKARTATKESFEELQAAREERRALRAEEQAEKQARRESFNPDVDLGPSPKRRRRARAAEEAEPASEEMSFQKNRGRKKAPMEAELAGAATSAAAAAAAAKAAKDAAPAYDDNGVATGDSLDEIVKKAANNKPKQTRPKSEPIVEEKFDVEAARAQMDEMEKAAGDADKPKKKYQLPPLDCLNPPKLSLGGGSEAELRDNAEKLIDVLQSFGVRTTLVDIARGPSVTRYELAPAAGVKLSKITGLADDIALNLAASGVRIAPIPGKTAVGIEVPNKDRDAVNLREVIESPEYKKGAQKSKLSVALGKDISGKICTMDIAKMPHLLIAGTTGSGKSVCVNAMILSILYNATPEEVKLVMIDPKKVEFSKYNGIPHLLVPVVTEPAKAAGSLQWAVREMLNRYQKFSDTGVRDIKGYNQMAAGDPDMEVMPQIVIFIDELADLMMATPKEVEDSICRLAQMARAAGMHMVIATQRPSVDVITGLIKANIPSRLSLYVASAVDSRTILDMTGAEKLLGNGDLLFNPVGVSKPTRIQGCFSSDKEIENVVTFIKSQEESEYDESIIKDIEAAAAATENANQKSGGVNAPSGGGDSSDDLFEQAIQVVLEAGQASTSMLQRKLGVGYARAGRIIDELEEHGIIGEYQGSKPRAVLITKQQWLERNAMSGDADDGTAAAIELGLDD